MTVLAALGAVTSVALGAIYMWSASAPPLYILVNAVALAVGATLASLIRWAPVRDRRFAGAATVVSALLLLATASWGVHIDGVSRWIRVAGVSLQPSLILLPALVVQFAKNRSWLSASGLAISSIALVLQPDRAMAGTLVAGLAASWLHRREPLAALTLSVAALGLAATILSADVVPPVPFVELVVQSAFSFHGLAGSAIIAGLAALLVPAAPALSASTRDRELFVVFGATWGAVIAFAIIGNYPTPLVGYGSSAILGYCLSAAMLSDPSSADPLTRTHLA